MPAIKCLVCRWLPMRMVLLTRPATPTLPISILLLPVVRNAPASLPNAMLSSPVVLLTERSQTVPSWPVLLRVAPVAVFDCRSVAISVRHRWPCCCSPVVLLQSASTTVGRVGLAGRVLRKRMAPLAVLSAPVVLL